MITFKAIAYALLGGILPALLWLWFWLHEDKKHPEPRGLIGRTFLLGMLAVILVIPFQKAAEIMLPGVMLPALLAWATLEEIFKFGAGYFGGIHSVEDNEPIDPIVYMITAALGFVALENALFILGPLVGEEITQGIITGNLRFIGASVLHVVSSGIIGVALAFTFYKKRLKFASGVWALVAAILFHTLFNMLVLNFVTWGTPLAFLMVWVAVIFIMWAFERAKSIAPQAEVGL